MVPVQPGTYRIVSVASGTCIINYVDKPWEVVCWHRIDDRNQQWFVQRSGEGYHIKNCLNGLYLTVYETSDTNPPAKVFCGPYPTTWELNQGTEDRGMYIIKRAGCDRVVDLDDWGKAHDGNTIHTHTQRQWLANKRWRFEHLSDDTGEEEQKLSKEIQSKNQQIAERDQKIKEQCAQLDEKSYQVAEKDKQLAELKAQLASQSEELSMIKLNFGRQSALLVQTQETLRRATETLATKGTDLLQTEAQDDQSHIKTELSQRKEKEEKLQERLESLERMVAEASTRS
ncbi:hypothetical protein FRC07_007741 [Ceratobasidium sp. 392]|nr:hypothetical protein FRC07_007741 [Ceratobasidium sp. 392]